MIQLTDAGRQVLRLEAEVVKATQRIAELEAELRKVLLAGEQAGAGVPAELEREAWSVLNGATNRG